MVASFKEHITTIKRDYTVMYLDCYKFLLMVYIFSEFRTNTELTPMCYGVNYISDEDRQCGGILTANSGVIMSVDRDGDGMYDNNLECVWVIVAPNTTLIELVFSSMEIEWHKNCESDYVRVKPKFSL